MKDSKEMNEEIAEVEDHSALAEIHAAVCMARDARLAQKDLHNDNEYTFTRLDFAAIKFECGKPDPLFFTPIPTTLYLYEGCLTSGLVQGNDCLKYWIHPPGQVLDLRDDQVTRVHVPGQTIHLLRTAKQRERKQSQETAGIPLGEFTTPVNQTHVCTFTSPEASSQTRNTLTADQTLLITSRRTSGAIFKAHAKKAREGRLKKAQEN